MSFGIGGSYLHKLLPFFLLQGWPLRLVMGYWRFYVGIVRINTGLRRGYIMCDKLFAVAVVGLVLGFFAVGFLHRLIEVEREKNKED